MEVTTWTKRNQERCQAATRMGEVIEPRNKIVGVAAGVSFPKPQYRDRRQWAGYRGTPGVRERGVASKADV